MECFISTAIITSILLLPLLLLLVLFKRHRPNQKNPYPNAPSPPGLPFLGHIYYLLKTPIHRALAHISDLHGPILLLRFGSRRVLLVSSYSGAEECLTVNDITFANRPRLLAGKYLGYNYSTLSWASYGPHWRNLRRIATMQVLSTHRLLSSSHLRSDEVLSLVKVLLRDYSGPGFHLAELRTKFFALSYNIVMRMIANKRYYGDADESSSEAGREFRDLAKETFSGSATSNAADLFPVVRWLGIGGQERRLKRLRKIRDRFFQHLVNDHRNKRECGSRGEEGSPAEKSTVIDVLLSLQEGDPDYYDDDMIKGFITQMLIAGTDTTLLTIEWIMSLLLNNPHILKRVREELDANIRLGSFLEEADFSKLPYLHAVINEALRMYPVGPILVPHESSQDCTINGFYVPSGTVLLVNVWKMHRDPELWDEPNKCKPERFLKGSDGSYEVINEGFKMMPFGLGRRRCPGEVLAMRVVALVVGTLVHCFEWERVGDEVVDMSEGLNLTLTKAKPLEAMYKPREFIVGSLIDHLPVLTVGSA
ncbi:Isoflavone 2'-hydroxylase protein [Dioscorea alata]|uniref:Isoflavone 2'-hydroxylase protein n=1 Tax=Dioscorea alata TaxID=55571 RepID=A0ACB7UWU0_DIOAL|nr:Isoflavone 2'-hydroxylase protein [Dioscorea alata]